MMTTQIKKAFKYMMSVSASILLAASTAAISAHAVDASGVPSMSEAPPNATLVYLDEGMRNWELGQRDVHIDVDGYVTKSPCPEGLVKNTRCDFSISQNRASIEQILPVCEATTDENCIVSLALGGTTGEVVHLSHEGYAGGNVFAAVPSQGLYESKTPSLWSGVGLDGSPVSLVATVKTYLSYYPKTKKFKTDRVLANVAAYQLVEDSKYFSPYSMHFVDDQGRDNMGSVAPDDSSCVWFADGQCGRAVSLPSDTSLSLTLHISNQISGWLRGRLKNPEIKIDEFSATNQVLEVTAEPAEVAIVGGFATAENTSAAGIDAIENWTKPKTVAFSENSKRFVDASSNQAFDFVDRFRQTLNDTAYASKAMWTFSSLDSRAIFGNSCLASDSKLVGLVTTNGAAYDGGIPTFADGYLSYRVAGLHYAPDGATPNIGTYDLLMDAESARCLYGYSKAPISATVQVVGAGSQNIATTVVSEKDGWLKLAAYGFTFSEKQIKVKVTQPQTKTLTKFAGSSKALSAKQKAEIKTVVNKAKGNPKFICTGTYVKATSKATALARARAACNYAKTLDKNHSYFAQAKQTTAKSYDAKVMLVSK